MGKSEDSMAEIQQLKAKRTKERTKTTKLISELKALFKAVHEDGRSTARYELDYNIEIGEAQLIQLEKLEDQLGALGVEDESAHIPDLHKAIGLGKRLLTELRQEATSQVPAMSQKPSFKLDFKLPKFNGDILAWPDFWEIYKASVHQNESYSAVQKLFYLRQHLDGAAAHAIQGLQLTAESYPVAIKILQDRFGKDDVRKESQITKLLSLPGVTNVDDLKSLRRLVDEVTAGVRSLEALNARDVGDVLLPVLKGKVPAAWRLQWARRRREQTTDDQGSEFPAFLEFLRNEVECQEESVRVPGNKINEEPTRPSPTSHKSTTSILSTQQVSPQKTSSWACPACRKGQHGLGRCDKYLQMPIDDRWTTVKAAGACFQCLGRHRVRDCRSGTCRRCQRPHHTTLHRDPTTAPTTTPTSPSGASARIPEVQQSRTDPVSLTAQPLHRPDQHVGPHAKASDTGVNQQHQSRRYTVQGDRQQCYIQTALVEGRGPQCTKMLRVLLDGGSDASYIRKSVAEEMGLNVIGSGTFACVGFQERAEEPCTYDRVRIELRSRHGGDVKEFELWCSDRLCAPLPPAEPPIESLKDLILADDFSGGQIDILIGADQFYMAVLKDCVVLGEGLRALDTIFGHVLHGQGSAISQPPRHVYHCRQVEEMWDLDTIGITPETEITKTKFPDPTWNDDENRYEMGLLWSSEQRPVTNRYSSTVRVNRMVEKLDESKREEYNNNIIQLKQEGVIEPSPSSESAESAFFLPHRGLHRNNKLRIVFDGSAKDGTGVSLNTYLESGDNPLRRLVGVLLKFRSHDVACQADIKAAFHQIAVKEEDRQYLQFLWEGQTLRFRRVPFGLTCSPYMLLKSIEKHLSQYQPTYPELCTKLATGLYMDDVAVGFESVGEAAEQMNVVQEMFHDANMEIHKVRMTGLPSEDAKILGMRWSTGSDILAVTIPAAAPPVTKSQLLSVISRPFDPLGILSPWVIRGKILFQQTWTEEGCPSWESELPPAIGSQVEKWWKEAKTIEDVEIPRSVGKLCDETVFHVFCDASSKAYCAVVYAVHGGESRLVIAKARLAPLRPNITIPRLELMAALIGVRLMRFIKETLNTDTSNILYWTDSMDVLFWIRSKKPLKVFVENRVSAILENSRPDQWRHVGTGQNPADLGTRGITLKSLVASKEWREGPLFLLQADVGRASIMQEEELQFSESAKKELKKETTTATQHVALAVRNEAGFTAPRDMGPFRLADCSALKQAVNRTAWIRRFIYNCRHVREDRVAGPLRPEERQAALQFWIKLSQEEVYASELEDIRSQRPVSHRSPLKSVRPHLDENGVLRAAPRTGEPAVIILPDLRHITTLIVEHAHRICFHQGVRSTLAFLSSEYLVRRRTVQRIVQSCTRCRRYKALPYQQTEGALPEFRTQPSRSFERVGIDYFGPLHIDDGSKVWGLLITCATSRAVHLEVVKSQSTDDLQIALRRFFALRGTPSLVVSDNAKSFRKILGLLPSSVKWRYIPESSPWWGGFWERLVGSVKAAMKVTLHQCHLTHEELVVVFYELAMQLNLRPLTEDITDGLLTPAHFLFGVTHIQGVISPTVEPATNLQRAWRNRKRVAEHLIKRWTDEYLQTLRAWNTRSDSRPVRTPHVGEIVLVQGEGRRGRWPLGRIQSLIPARDGVARAAVIALRGRLTRRPVSKLFRLEAYPDDAASAATSLPSDPSPEPRTRNPDVEHVPVPSTHHQTTRAGRHVRPVNRYES